MASESKADAEVVQSAGKPSTKKPSMFGGILSQFQANRAAAAEKKAADDQNRSERAVILKGLEGVSEAIEKLIDNNIAPMPPYYSTRWLSDDRSKVGAGIELANFAVIDPIAVDNGQEMDQATININGELLNSAGRVGKWMQRIIAAGQLGGDIELIINKPTSEKNGQLWLTAKDTDTLKNAVVKMQEIASRQRELRPDFDDILAGKKVPIEKANIRDRIASQVIQGVGNLLPGAEDKSPADFWPQTNADRVEAMKAHRDYLETIPSEEKNAIVDRAHEAGKFVDKVVSGTADALLGKSRGR